MHPLLTNRRRLLLYVAAWIPLTIGLGALLNLRTPREPGELALVLLPLVLLLAFDVLSAWWVCRGAPLGTTPLLRIVGTHTMGAAGAALLWLVLGPAWVSVLTRHRGIVPYVPSDWMLLGAAAAFLYFVSAIGHYLMLAFEQSRLAERRMLESRVAARDAELRALRAQLDPHFLFNSLNSINALVGSRPEDARRVCVGLGDFLRETLRVGARDFITLREELTLADHYLEIEQVRFGARLTVVREIAPDAAPCVVPPLLIQPLVENAVRHGIANLLEGGTVRIEARVRPAAKGGVELLEIVVENPSDPTAPVKRGAGVGLDNVRRRLEALSVRDGSLEVNGGGSTFQVRLRLPVVHDAHVVEIGRASCRERVCMSV